MVPYVTKVGEIPRRVAIERFNAFHQFFLWTLDFFFQCIVVELYCVYNTWVKGETELMSLKHLIWTSSCILMMMLSITCLIWMEKDTKMQMQIVHMNYGFQYLLLLGLIWVNNLSWNTKWWWVVFCCSWSQSQHVQIKEVLCTAECYRSVHCQRLGPQTIDHECRERKAPAFHVWQWWFWDPCSFPVVQH